MRKKFNDDIYKLTCSIIKEKLIEIVIEGKVLLISQSSLFFKQFDAKCY